MANDATRTVVATLKRILEDNGVEARTEYLYRPWQRKRSARADVAGLLPSGRPILLIEVDSTQPGASHNSLKLWSSPLELARLPIAVLRVWFDGAARGSDVAGALVQAGLALPPRLVSTPPLILDGSEDDDALTRYLEQFLIEPRLPDAEEVTLAPVLQAYQQLQCYGALDVAAAHLAAQVDLAWFLVGNGKGSVLRASQLSCTLARLLQQGGRPAAAATAAERIRRELGDSQPERALDPVLADELKAIEFKLQQPAYGSADSRNLLDAAMDGLALKANRAKFTWRRGLDAVLEDRRDEAVRYIGSYLNLLADERNAHANQALVQTCSALTSSGSRKAEWAITSAKQYCRIERTMWRDFGSAVDGSIHGVITGLYLQLAALRRIQGMDRGPRRSDLERLASDLDALRTRLGISWKADGLRDVAPFIGQEGAAPRTPPSRVRLHDVLAPSRYFLLEGLCDRFDELSELAYR